MSDTLHHFRERENRKEIEGKKLHKLVIENEHAFQNKGSKSEPF